MHNFFSDYAWYVNAGICWVCITTIARVKLSVWNADMTIRYVKGMTRRQSHHEVIVLLALGVKPKALIAKGYSESTVYNYHKKLPLLRKRLEELIQE